MCVSTKTVQACEMLKYRLLNDEILAQLYKKREKNQKEKNFRKKYLES